MARRAISSRADLIVPHGAFDVHALHPADSVASSISRCERTVGDNCEGKSGQLSATQLA
jgi:hypothetical protein